MSDDEKNAPKLWHEHLDNTKIAEFADELIEKFISMGIRIHRISVTWDDEGGFLSETRGEEFQRRIEDIKPPERH